MTIYVFFPFWEVSNDYAHDGKLIDAQWRGQLGRGDQRADNHNAPL